MLSETYLSNFAIWVIISFTFIGQTTMTAQTGSQQADTLDVIWKEDFSNGIPITWQNEIFDSNGNIYSNAQWEYRGPNTIPSNDTGSRGAYSNPSNYIQSLSRDNGFIIFDADYLDNDGQKGNWGNGPAPAPHSGVLVSENIDLSGSGSNEMLLVFNSRFRTREARALLCLSTDNGISWPDTVKLHENITQGYISKGDKQIIIDLSHRIDSANQVKLQFIFDGMHDNPDILGNAAASYYWMLDDICIIQKPDYLLAVKSKSINHAPSSKYFPNGIFHNLQPRRNETKFFSSITLNNIGKLPITELKFSTAIHSKRDTLNALDLRDTILPDSQITIDQNFDLAAVDYGYFHFSQEMGFDSNYTYFPQLNTFPDTIFKPLAFGLHAEKQVITQDGWTSQKGSGYANRFRPAQDGARFGTAMYVESRDYLTEVKVYLGDSTIAGGDVFIEIKDTLPTFHTGFDSTQGGDWPNVLLRSDPYRITENDIEKGYLEIEIPELLTGGGFQDRELNPNLYYVSVSLFSNNGRNPITILENETIKQGKYASIYYHYPKGKWFTDGNALGIIPIFGERYYYERCRPETKRIVDTICSEEFYYFQGEYLTEEGIYEADFINSEGCDSTVILTLRVYDAIPVGQSETLCKGDTFSIGDTSFTTSGNFNVLIEKSNTCDTNYTLNLNFVDSLQKDSTAYFCEGDSVLVNGRYYSNSGNFPIIYPSQDYCDTLLDLEVIEVSADTSILLEVKTLKINLDHDFDKVEWVNCDHDYVVKSTSWWTEARSYRPSSSGSYKARIFKKGCVFETSCINVLLTGVHNPNQKFFELWPSPVSESVNLKFKNPEERILIISDLAGREVLEKSSLKRTASIDVSNLSSGMFLVKVISSNGEIRVQKIIIK